MKVCTSDGRSGVGRVGEWVGDCDGGCGCERGEGGLVTCQGWVAKSRSSTQKVWQVPRGLTFRQVNDHVPLPRDLVTDLVTTVDLVADGIATIGEDDSHAVLVHPVG